MVAVPIRVGDVNPTSLNHRSIHPDQLAGIPWVRAIKTVQVAAEELSSERSRYDRMYAYAIIGSYVDTNVHTPAFWRRGKGLRLEVGHDLELLECDFPQFSHEFHLVRKAYKLQPSSVLAIPDPRSFIRRPSPPELELEAPPLYPAEHPPAYSG